MRLATFPTLALLTTLLPDASVQGQNNSALPAEWRPLAREVLKELIELDTTHVNGAGAASAAIASRLRGAGFLDEDLTLAGLAPNKLNLVVRLRGKGKAERILFLVHLDVVAAKREDWTVDPFKLTEADGYFYGRGTTDIKNEAADLVVNLIRWKGESWAPAGDLIFAFTDDEEGGASQSGMDWLLENRPELVKAAFAINLDAGGGNIKNGKRAFLDLQTSEKVYLSLKLEVTDKGGHSSLPTDANPIFRLAGALDRIGKHRFSLRSNETTRGYFAVLAGMEPSASIAADMRTLSREPLDPLAGARVAAASPYYNALLRTTCVATEITGGHAENALPQLARATVNCRIHPDESVDEVEATLKRLAGDASIQFTRMSPARPSPPSALRKDIVGAMQSVADEIFPGNSVAPSMSTGASDGVFLRNRGVPVYGVSGMYTDMDDPRAHGRDERIGVGAFHDGVEFMYRFVKALDRGR